MNKPKDYVHLNLYVKREDETKMTQEEMSQLHEDVMDHILDLDKGYEMFGGAELIDDEELAAELDYDDKRLEAQSFSFSDDRDSQLAFLAGAEFVRSIVDQRYRNNEKLERV